MNHYKPTFILTDRLHSYLFFAYAILFIWLPMPLGSKYPWATSYMEIWIYSLAIGVSLALASGSIKLPTSFSKNRLAIVLFMSTTVWIAIQCISLPQAWLNWLSPQSANLYAQADNTQASISLNTSISWLQFHKTLALMLLFVLTLILVDSYKRLKSLVYIIVFSGFVQAMAALLLNLSGLAYTVNQYTYSISDVNIPSSARATGFSSNPDHLAGWLEMTLAVGIGLLISMLSSQHFSNWRQRVRHYSQTILGPKARLRFVLIILCITLVMTHSRMGNTAFFVSLMISGAIFIFLSRHASKSVIIFLTSLIIIDIVIIGSWFGFSKVVQRINQTTTISEAQRGDVYADTLAMSHDFTLTGIGAGNFFSAFPAYKIQGPSYYIDHVHNDYLEFTLNLGLIGTAPLFLLLLLCGWNIVHNLKQRRSSLILGINFASLMGITSILIHSSVDFNLQVPANAALFTMLVALPFACRNLKS